MGITLFAIAFIAGIVIGGKYEVRIKTIGGVNVTYTDSTGKVKNLF